MNKKHMGEDCNKEIVRIKTRREHVRDNLEPG